MRKTRGGLVVLLFATLAILTIAAGDETSISHPAHLTTAYSLLRASPCDACHDTDNFPYFKTVTNIPPYNLSTTDICDGCHRPGGIYNVVDNALIVAKDNWHTGVYKQVYDPNAGNMTILQAGKERWWVGCHDYDPPVANGERRNGTSPVIVI